MNPIAFLPGARWDYDNSFNWYCERSATAADRFAAAIDVAFNELRRTQSNSP